MTPCTIFVIVKDTYTGVIAMTASWKIIMMDRYSTSNPGPLALSNQSVLRLRDNSNGSKSPLLPPEPYRPEYVRGMSEELILCRFGPFMWLLLLLVVGEGRSSSSSSSVYS